MDNLQRRAINFDLDTKKMREAFVYPSGYGKINQSMKENGFEHRQGSGYVSLSEIGPLKLELTLKKLLKANPWLKDCVKRLDITEVGKNFDMTNAIRDLAVASPTSAPLREDEMDM